MPLSGQEKAVGSRKHYNKHQDPFSAGDCSYTTTVFQALF